MSVEIITVGFCPQYFATYSVAGSRGAVYTVSLSGGEGPAFCTCPAYKFSGQNDCKHISAVWKHACLYNPQWKDAGPNDLGEAGIVLDSLDEHRTYDEPCPGCGGNMVPVRIAV